VIRWTLVKALFAGVGVLFLAQALYLGVLIKISYHEQLRLILLGSPALAAFAAAYFAPRRKLMAGLLMAICGAAIGTLSSLAYEFLGLHVDRIGGLLATFLILLAYDSVLSFLGGAAGVFFSRSSQGQPA